MNSPVIDESGSTVNMIIQEIKAWAFLRNTRQF